MRRAFHQSFLQGLIMSAGDTGDPYQSRASLINTVAEAERGLAVHWGGDVARAARRMVTVWLDELLLGSPWPGRELWLRKPLQSEWGEGRSGGAWFFQFVENLRPSRRDERELAALALRCISLGLMGSYARSPEKLSALRRDILARFDFKDDSPLFPPPLPAVPPKRRLNFVRFLLPLFALVCLLWLLGNFALNHRADLLRAGAEFSESRAR